MVNLSTLKPKHVVRYESLFDPGITLLGTVRSVNCDTNTVLLWRLSDQVLCAVDASRIVTIVED